MGRYGCGMAGPRTNWKLAAIWLIVTAYNLFKPYHIDDAAHLEIARWIAAHPLHPMQGLLNWEHGTPEPIYVTNQPHLYFYLLAGWGALFGTSEPAMHALQAGFAGAAILLFHRIACRIAPARAVWLTAMLALGPAFLVEQNLMVDVPLLALWLLCFDALTDTAAPARRRFAVAAAACSAALLVKYSSLLLLPILAATIVQEQRWRQAWVLLVPAVVLGAWSGFNLFDYGGIHLLGRHAGAARAGNPMEMAVAWLLTLGAVTPFGLVAGLGVLRGPARWRVVIYAGVAAGFAALAVAVVTGRVGQAATDDTLRAAFFVNAGAMLVAVAARRRQRADGTILVLMLWLAGHFAFYSLFAPFMAARHLLLVLPAVLLLAGVAELRRADMAAGLLGTLLLSGGVGLADWRFAAFFRHQATAIPASLPPGARVWFTGHWGWQWYAAQAGLRMVDVDHPALLPGDFVVIPWDIANEGIVSPPAMTLVRSVTKNQGLGDLFCTAGPARFYQTFWTQLPWRLTADCPNRLMVYRVD